MPTRSPIRFSWLLLVPALVACGIKRAERSLVPPSEIGRLSEIEHPYLKAHMKSGRVYVFTDWNAFQDGQGVSGEGRLLGVNRELISQGHFQIRIDSVAVFETNELRPSPAIAAMAVITTASLALTVYCVSNPKACFGSCPTFYVDGQDGPVLHAEGFSASVAPSLEATDIDAFFQVQATDRSLEIHMRNEALETHVVRGVNLLLAPRAEGTRVFATSDSGFQRGRGLIGPDRCLAAEGDCTRELAAYDGIERSSLADSIDLATKETIELEFNHVPEGELGLVIACRQSLLTTYWFYQTLAYMGTTVGDWFARLETPGGEMIEPMAQIGKLLGGIEVFVEQEGGEWKKTGGISETGPLATDVKVVPLGAMVPRPLKVRLRLTQGNWRLDYVALTRLEETVEPSRLAPWAVIYKGAPDETALRRLRDPEETLVTYPGDDYTLVYELPEDFSAYELFLESRGYYIEWMREEWLREEDPIRAARMLFDPAASLIALAPAYKKVEATMEEIFWSSRYGRR